MLHVLSAKDSNLTGHQSSDIQVKFEIHKSHTLELSSSQIKSSPKTNVSPSNYCIVKDRSRRNIKSPQQYVETDLVAYALSITKDIHYSEVYVNLIGIPHNVDFVGIR